MPNDISRVADAVQIAQRTFSIARQSILVGIGLSLMLMVVFLPAALPPDGRGGPGSGRRGGNFNACARTILDSRLQNCITNNGTNKLSRP